MAVFYHKPSQAVWEDDDSAGAGALFKRGLSCIPVISPDMIPSCIKTIIVMPVYAMEQIQHKTGKKQINVIGIDELIEASLKE